MVRPLSPLQVMDLRWASADHRAPVAMVVASSYPMPSGHHLRGPTLPMAATRAKPLANKANKVSQHPGSFFVALKWFRKEMAGTNAHLSTIAPLHELQHQFQHQFQVYWRLSTLPTTFFRGIFCKHFKSVGMIEEL